MRTMTTKAMAMLAAAGLMLGACKHDGSTQGGAQGAKPPRPTSAAIGELLAAVPGDAAALAFLDLDEAPWALVTGGWPLPLDEETRKSLDKELREYVGRYLGLDVSKLQYAVGFVSGPPPRGAVLLKTVSGAPKMEGAGDYEGAKVWRVDPRQKLSLAIRKDVIVFGEDTSVRDAIDTMAGKRKAVTEENKALVDWLRKEGDGAAIALAVIKPKNVPVPPPVAGLERFALSIGTKGVTAVVDGDDASISWLQARADEGIAKAIAEIEQAHDAALAGRIDPAEGAGAIIAAAYAKSYSARLKPKRTGNRLSVSFEIGAATNATMMVSMVGIVTAVAIPAFMDYMKRSKKTEASLQLNKLAKLAKLAYSETSAFPVGDAPLTPPQPCCGQPNNHCAAVPELYAASAVWKALDFQIDEPTLYQYSYRSDGQRFVARAVGDLDCDGQMVTYELTGSVDNGNPSVTLTEPAINAD
jgi:Tfp pilus assembly protein PilE